MAQTHYNSILMALVFRLVRKVEVDGRTDYCRWPSERCIFDSYGSPCCLVREKMIERLLDVVHPVKSDIHTMTTLVL